MSKQKKTVSSTNRTFKLIHQSLVISDINFRRQTIVGWTELTVLPLTNTGKLWKLPLNCKQCRILKVAVNGSHNANFSYVDPTLSICPPDTKKRNLEYYDHCHHDAVQSCDSDYIASAGELVIKIPKGTYDDSGRFEGKPLKVMIEFSLEQPKGGVQFVVPPGSSLDAMQHVHMFTYGWENSSRLWFPCVDSYTEPCHWTLSLTVSSNMTAVSCGDLMEQLLSSDGKKKVFHYSLTVPTTAPCIAFAIGCFEVYPDPVMQEITHFCLPGLMPILRNTVQFVHEVFGFYEELLSTRFPHSSYKLVFVDHAYQEAASYSTLGIFSTNLLHSARVIDQAPLTRRLIAHAIAQQYFGCYILPQLWNDWWLPWGVAGFISGLFCKKIFGSTEYQYWIIQEQRRVCQYECEYTLPPLCGTLAALQVTPTSAGSSGTPSHHVTTHPHLVSERELDMLKAKAHLVIRMIQLKIGHELLVQVFHKLLTLASTFSQTTEYGHWHNLLISTGGFMKSILTVSGKDLSHFMEQWVCRNGVPRFHAAFSYVRKRNIVELRLKQDLPRGYSKFMGPMTVVVQEFDGCFSHNIQVEDSLTTHELPCHSKIRKSKKRKVPLSHGEEVDIDISSMDMEVPVLWVRVDPEYQWIRQLIVEQADTIWYCLLKYERDATAQLEAIEALEGFPSTFTRDLLRDTVFNSNFYYHVRIQAAQSLAKLLTATASSGGSPSLLVSVFQKLFGTQAIPTIVRYNDFSDIATYFLQKALPLCIAGMRNVHGQCQKEVVVFLTELLKYSDNQLNKFSDGYYTSTLIDALGKTVTPKVAMVTQAAGVDFSKTPIAGLSPEAQTILQEIVQHLNIEKVLPSYRYAVTASCLGTLRVLQRNGHLPADSSLFREYAIGGNFTDVRLAALGAIVDIVQADHSESDLNFLLDLVENDEPAIRLAILKLLASSPPFTRRTESKLNTLELVERLWTLIRTGFSHDSRLRNAAVDLYSALYGRLTPTCVPQGLGIVIDLKEKVARSSLTSPAVTPSPGVGAEEIRGKITSPLATVAIRKEGGISITSPAGVQTPAHVSTTPLPPMVLKLSSVEQIPTVTVKRDTPKLVPLPGSSGTSTTKTPHSLHLKISAAYLKRPSPTLGAEALDTITPSPESVFSGIQSDDASSPYPHKPKKHKGERRHKKKHKHKEHKHKHKHKRSREPDTP